MSLASVDKFFGRKYDSETYNCVHLSRDVWLEETGEDISERLSGLLAGQRERKLRLSTRRAFRRLERPVSPCVVIMQQPRQQPHMGVFLRGKVLHFYGKTVEFLPIDLATRGYKTAKFYR